MVVLSRLILILSLIAGSTGMAPMRGQMAGLSQIAICSDGGAAVITLDAHGNPVAPQHPCPDCVGSGAAISAFVDTVLRQVTARRFQACLLHRGVATAERRVLHPLPRGPPSLV